MDLELQTTLTSTRILEKRDSLPVFSQPNFANNSPLNSVSSPMQPKMDENKSLT